jgi:hypothetical protein
MSDLRIGQTYFNRLLLQERWQTPEDIVEYLQKFAPGDPILIQLTTNYDPTLISVKLIDEDGSVNPSANFVQSVLYSYSDGSGNIVYNFLLDQSSIVFYGLKWVEITTLDPNNPPIKFISESFEFGDYAWLPMIKWQGSDRDGIYWDDAGTTIFGIRAELAEKYSATSESSIYEGFNFQPETLLAVPKLMSDLVGDPMPRYICETLELAFKHYSVWINDVPYSANGASAKISKIDRSNLYEFNIQVIQVDYEDYSVLTEISGTVIKNSVFKNYNHNTFVNWNGNAFTGQL